MTVGPRLRAFFRRLPPAAAARRDAHAPRLSGKLSAILQAFSTGFFAAAPQQETCIPAERTRDTARMAGENCPHTDDGVQEENMLRQIDPAVSVLIPASFCGDKEA